MNSLTARCLIVSALALALAGCGFHLRGQATLPFNTLYVQAAPLSPFALQLKRAVQSGSLTKIIDRPEQAEAILQILQELQEKEILSLGAGGRVREFQLRYRVQFRLTDEKNREHIPATEIVLQARLLVQRRAGAVQGIGGSAPLPRHAHRRGVPDGAAPAGCEAADLAIAQCAPPSSSPSISRAI